MNVRYFKGTRSQYDAHVAAGKIIRYCYYLVIEDDGSISLYLGFDKLNDAQEIKECLLQIQAIEQNVELIESSLEELRQDLDSISSESGNHGIQIESINKNMVTLNKDLDDLELAIKKVEENSANKESVEKEFENIKKSIPTKTSDLTNNSGFITITEAKVEAEKVKSELLNGAGGAYDTLKELGDLIDDNVDAIAALTKIATNKADKSEFNTLQQQFVILEQTLANFTFATVDDIKAMFNKEA